MKCRICGFIFCEAMPEDRKNHRTWHRRIMGIIKKFGFFFHYEHRELIKKTAWAKVDDETLPIEVRVESGVRVLMCYFSRSIGVLHQGKRHPGFYAWANTFLNREGASVFPGEVRKALLDKYPEPKPSQRYVPAIFGT